MLGRSDRRVRAPQSAAPPPAITWVACPRIAGVARMAICPHAAVYIAHSSRKSLTSPPPGMRVVVRKERTLLLATAIEGHQPDRKRSSTGRFTGEISVSPTVDAGACLDSFGFRFRLGSVAAADEPFDGRAGERHDVAPAGPRTHHRPCSPRCGERKCGVVQNRPSSRRRSPSGDARRISPPPTRLASGRRPRRGTQRRLGGIDQLRARHGWGGCTLTAQL